MSLAVPQIRNETGRVKIFVSFRPIFAINRNQLWLALRATVEGLPWKDSLCFWIWVLKVPILKDDTLQTVWRLQQLFVVFHQYGFWKGILLPPTLVACKRFFLLQVKERMSRSGSSAEIIVLLYLYTKSQSSSMLLEKKSGKMCYFANQMTMLIS